MNEGGKKGRGLLLCPGPKTPRACLVNSVGSCNLLPVLLG
jgi:hypothetical protein